MTESKDTTEKTRGGTAGAGAAGQAAVAAADGRVGTRAAELQPRPLQVGGGREEQEAQDSPGRAPRPSRRSRRPPLRHPQAKPPARGPSRRPRAPTGAWRRAADALRRGARRARARSGRRARARGRGARAGRERCRARAPGRAAPRRGSASHGRGRRPGRAGRCCARDCCAGGARRPQAAAAPSAPAPEPARAPKTFNPALMPREGGRPKEISLPGPRRAPAATPQAEAPKRPGRPAAEAVDEDEGRAGVKRPGAKVARAPAKPGDERRERVKLTINNAFDEQQRERSLASLKRKREREKLKAMGIPQPARRSCARSSSRRRSPSRSCRTA